MTARDEVCECGADRRGAHFCPVVGLLDVGLDWAEARAGAVDCPTCRGTGRLINRIGDIVDPCPDCTASPMPGGEE